MFFFRNIGLKIKILALIILFLGIFTSFTCGIIIIIENTISQGVFIIIIGFVASWLSTFLMYGFGELIDKTTEIANNTKKDKNITEE